MCAAAYELCVLVSCYFTCKLPDDRQGEVEML